MFYLVQDSLYFQKGNKVNFFMHMMYATFCPKFIRHCKFSPAKQLVLLISNTCQQFSDFKIILCL